MPSLKNDSALQSAPKKSGVLWTASKEAVAFDKEFRVPSPTKSPAVQAARDKAAEARAKAKESTSGGMCDKDKKKKKELGAAKLKMMERTSPPEAKKAPEVMPAFPEKKTSSRSPRSSSPMRDKGFPGKSVERKTSFSPRAEAMPSFPEKKKSMSPPSTSLSKSQSPRNGHVSKDFVDLKSKSDAAHTQPRAKLQSDVKIAGAPQPKALAASRSGSPGKSKQQSKLAFDRLAAELKADGVSAKDVNLCLDVAELKELKRLNDLKKRFVARDAKHDGKKGKAKAAY